MACPTEEVLVDFVEGRLADDSLGHFHSHVDSCGSCRDLVAALARRHDDHPAHREPKIGDTISHYRIERQLGRGGMGVVYAAVDTRLQRGVALKFIAPHLLGNARAAARLQREARAASALDHPSLGQIYDVGEPGNFLFIAMPLYEGETLQERLRRGPLPPRDAVDVLLHIAEGLAAAHRAGVVHRDIKPSNIILCTDGGTRILDFGLAKLSEPDVLATSSGNVVGTVAYMAPEQQQGGPVDARADLWSLGVTAYEMLSGRLPFAGASPLEVLAAAATRDPPPLRLSADLETIVGKCLEKTPARRYPTADELARDLRSYRSGDPIAARRAPVRRLLLRLKRRSAVLVATLSLATALGVSGLAWRARQRAIQTRRQAERMAGLAEQLRLTLRTANLLPLHDTRQQRDSVRRQVEALEHDVATQPAENRAAASYAIGWGRLVLGDYAAAQRNLAAVYTEGDRRPELAYGLGYVTSLIYRTALDAARRIEDADRRRQRETVAATELREPALAYLRAARGTPGVSPESIEALIALDDRRYDDARQHAHNAFAADAMDYDAGRLEVLAMLRQRIQGDRTSAELRELFSTIDAMYTRLFEIGRSDVTLYRAAAADLLEVALRIPDGKPLVRVLALCALTRRADSGDAQVDAIEAQAELAQAELDRQHGEGQSAIKRALAAVQRALAHDPRNAQALMSGAYAWNLVAQDQFSAGVDPLPALAHALKNLEQAEQIAPDDELYDRFGVAHAVAGQWQAAHGIDPRDTWQRALGDFRRSIAVYPKSAAPHNNIATVSTWLANDTWKHGGDPTREVDAALAECAQALAVERNAYSFGARADAYLVRARHLLWSSGDPQAALAATMESANEAVAIDANDPEHHLRIADAQLLAAEERLRSSEDPVRAVALGMSHARTAAQLNPKNGEAHTAVSRLTVVTARCALAHGTDPTSALAEAVREAERGVQANPTSVEARVAAADAYRWSADPRRHRSATRETAAALEHLRVALATNPTDAAAHVERGKLLNASDPATAKAEIARGLQLNHWLATVP